MDDILQNNINLRQVNVLALNFYIQIKYLNIIGDTFESMRKIT